MNNVIDALAQSPPQAESTEASGKGYVLIPLGLGEVTELTNYPYLVLMSRPDWAEQNPKLVSATARAVSRAGALFHTNPDQAKAALRAHRFSIRSGSTTIYSISPIPWSSTRFRPGETWIKKGGKKS